MRRAEEMKVEVRKQLAGQIHFDGIVGMELSLRVGAMYLWYAGCAACGVRSWCELAPKWMFGSTRRDALRTELRKELKNSYIISRIDIDRTESSDNRTQEKMRKVATGGGCVTRWKRCFGGWL